MKRQPRVLDRRMAGPDHAVITLTSTGDDYMRSPCKECPWRKANAGSFPPEAFKHSTSTASDMSTHAFACHMAGSESLMTCAGFLLSETAVDNLAVRIGLAKGRYEDVIGDRSDLFATYKRMAVANGVKRNDPSLERCMPEARNRYFRRIK